MKANCLLPILSCVLAFSCDTENLRDNFETPDWTEATHGKTDSPDYATVFNQAKVKALHVKMTPEVWSTIQEDMKTKTGSTFGSGTRPNQGNGPLDLIAGDPVYVALEVFFEGKEWYKVGFRLKGNSTLASSWRNGVYKLPFRLNFDKFEDEYPQIKNQRFHGFKELSFSPGAKDNSLIREKLGADIMKAAGVPAASTSFYQVYVDFGTGEQYCGVYTMVEVIDDTMVKNNFGDDTGNIYKPESRLETFSIAEFEKKNNKEESDYTDIQEWIAALNSSTPDRLAWRTRLEASMDVNHFLKWLAVNTAMVNWDSYGIIAHNYYIYNHPDKGITWIPWDHNEVMNGRGGASTGPAPLTLSFGEVSAHWPLIYNLIKDPVYNEIYRKHVADFTSKVFTPEKMNAMFDHHYNLISPYVVGPLATESGKYSQLPSTTAFQTALQPLKDHVVARGLVIAQFLQ